MATLPETAGEALQGVQETENVAIIHVEEQPNDSAAELVVENQTPDLETDHAPQLKEPQGEIISPDLSFITLPTSSWNGSSAAESFNISEGAVICSACGIQANDHADWLEWTSCSVCDTERYCSHECQQWDWTSGGHGEICKGMKVQIEHGPMGPPDPGELPVVQSKENMVRQLLSIAGSTPSVTSFTSDLSSQPSSDSGSNYNHYRSSLVTRWQKIDDLLQREDSEFSASETIRRLLPGILDEISDSGESCSEEENGEKEDHDDLSSGSAVIPGESSSVVTDSEHSITELLAARLERNLSGKGESLSFEEQYYCMNVSETERSGEPAFGIEKDYDLMDYDNSQRSLHMNSAVKQGAKSGDFYDIIFVPSEDSSTSTGDSLRGSGSIASDGIIIPPFPQLIMDRNAIYGVDMEAGLDMQSNAQLLEEANTMPEQKKTERTPEEKNRRLLLIMLLLLMAAAIITLSVFFAVFFSSSKRNSQTVSTEDIPTNQTTTAPHVVPQPTESPSRLPDRFTVKPVSLAPSRSPSRVSSTPAPSHRPTTSSPIQSPSAKPSRAQRPSAKPSSVQSNTPTRAPSRPPTFGGDAQQLFEQLAPRTFDNGTSILIDGSPQNQAFMWLSNSSGFENASTTRLVQRYALATFYFSTNGDSWRYNNRWLSASDECSWFTDSRDSPCDQSGGFQTLQFIANDLSGGIPDEVALLKNLTTIAVIGGPRQYLSGTLPTYLGNLSDLEVLKLKGNLMNGTIPRQYGGLRELMSLDLSDNKFTGGLPTSLENLSKLTSLDISNNRMTGELPDGALSIANMVQFSVAGNSFTGAIPTSISAMAKIEKLSLESNKFESLPSQIGRLTTLSQLTIFDNRINGTLPSQIGALNNMAFLSLHTNDFYGRLPTTLGLMTSLELFEASSNAFSGPIPSEVGLMQALVKFRVTSNKLSGGVPTAFSRLPDLDTLLLDGNNITGKVPSQLCSSFSSRYAYIFYADCGPPDPEVNCTCCTHCCSDRSGCEAV